MSSEITAVINEGCHFEGNLNFDGVGRISGSVDGKITSTDTVIISPNAIINADIVADIILISGIVNGNLQAHSRVEIKRPAKFEGSIVSPSLIVEEGVVFHGVTKMKDKN